MADKRKVEVVIRGEVVQLLSSEDETYLQGLAAYVNRKVTEVLSMGSVAAVRDWTRTLLIALNVADDYYKSEVRLKAVEKELTQLKKENSLLTAKTTEAEALRDAAKLELEQFMENFDNDNVVSIAPRSAKGAKKNGQA